MKICSRSKWLLAGGLVSLVSACAGFQSGIQHNDFVKPELIHARARYVAVLPFTNHTTFPNAGSIAGDLLSTELYARSDFKIMERTMMLKTLQGEKAEVSPDEGQMAALDAGKALGVDTVIFGSVTEYGYRKGLNEDPVVGIDARMLDVKTDTIVWAGARTLSGGKSLAALTRDACHLLIASMLAR